MMKKYSIGVLIGLVLCLLSVGLINYCVDPFYHYHKPYFGFQPLVYNERYQNPGIVTHFDYDALIIGSSMTENFRTSEFDKTFNCKTVKVPYAGERTGSYNLIFEKAFSTHKIRKVFMGLDMFSLISPYGARLQN